MPKAYTQQREMPLRIGAPFDNTRIPAESGVGRGLRKISGDIGNATDLYNARAEQMADERNKMKVLTETNNLAQEVDRHVKDVKENKKGSLAGNAYKESNEWFDKTVGEQYEPRFENDYQRELFEQQKLSIKTSLLKTVATHQAEEHQREQTFTHQSTMARIAIDLSKNDNPSIQFLKEKKGEAVVAIRSIYQGVDTKAKELEAESALGTSYITGVMAKDPRRAMAELNSGYFDGTISPKARVDLSRRIEDEIDRRDVKYLSSQAVSQYPDDIVGQARFITESHASPQAKINAFRNIDVQRSAAEAIKEKAQRQLAKDLSSQAYKLFDENKKQEAIELVESKKDGLGPEMYAQLMASVSKVRPKDSSDKYAEISRLIDNGNISYDYQIDLIRNDLTQADEEKLREQVKSVKPEWKKFTEELQMEFDDIANEGSPDRLNQDEREAKWPTILRQVNNLRLDATLSRSDIKKKFREVVDTELNIKEDKKEGGGFFSGLSPSAAKNPFTKEEITKGINEARGKSGKTDYEGMYDMIQSNPDLLNLIIANLPKEAQTPYNIVNVYEKNKDKFLSVLNPAPEQF